MATSSKTSTRSTTGFLRGTRGKHTSGSTVQPSRKQAKRRKRAASRHALSVRVGKTVGKVREWLVSTVTPGGWLLVVVASVGFVAGLANGWLELVGAGVVSWVLILLALLFLLSTRSLNVFVDLLKDRVVVGENLTGGLTVENTGKAVSLPTQINLPIADRLAEVGIPFLRVGGTFSQELEIPTHRRGVIPFGPPGAVRSSPIGVFARETVWGKPKHVYVYPLTVRLPSTESGLLRDLEGRAAARIVNDDLSFHAIREYAPGDLHRQIHWKSTAKTGQLMVRQYEETLRSEMLVVLDTREEAYADEDQFELAVSAATSFGLRGLQDGRNLSFVAGLAVPMYQAAGRANLFEVHTTSRRTLLDDSARLRWTDYGTPLPLLTESAGADTGLGGEGTSVAVVVTGSETTWGDIRSAALKFPVDVAVLTIICDQDAEPGVVTSGGVTAVTIAILDDLPGLMARRAKR